MTKYIRTDIEWFHDYDYWVSENIIYLGSVAGDYDNDETGVDFQMASRFIKSIAMADRKNKPIEIRMNNPGGDEYHGIAIFDAIQECKNDVTIKVYGHAMSMGAWILQAADNRIMMPNSRLMIHDGYFGIGSVHPKVFESWAEESKLLRKKMYELFASKMGITLRKAEKICAFDKFYSASEAVEAGLADEVYSK